MRICLINPPDKSKQEEDYEYCFSMRNIPHIGVGYIAAFLEENGFSVDVIECLGQGISLKDLNQRLVEQKYEVIGISTYDYNLVNVVKIVSRIKAANPSTFVFVGGYFATLCYEKVLNNLGDVDCCVLGEGEYTCLELVKTLQNQGNFRTVAGIAFKEKGQIIKTPSRALIEDLDSLPTPKRTFISPKGVATVISSRGCYGACVFCAIRAFYKESPGKVVRFRRPEKVVEEITDLVQNHGVKYIGINDDNFLGSSPKQRERIERFYQLVKEKNLNVKFRAFARANEIEPCRELLIKLKEIGFDYLLIGIESFVKRQLEFYNKKISVAENLTAIKVLREIGIKIDLGFLMLEPFTTIDELLENINMLKASEYYNNAYEGCAPISMFMPIVPYYGSEFHNLMEQKGLLANNDYGYEFQDQKVALFYDIVKRWVNRISPLHYKYYLILKAMENNEVEIERRLQDQRIKLVKIDLDLLEELVLLVKSGEIQLEGAEGYLEPWEQRIQPILDCFLEAGAMLKKYS